MLVISHLNLGWDGRRAADIASTTYGYSYLSGYRTIGAHLMFVNIGINDWTAGTTVASFTASMQKMVVAARLSGNVVLMTPFPNDLSAAGQSAQDAIVAAIRQLGATNGEAVIDNRARFGSYAKAVADGRAADFYKLHPNTAGYAMMADSVTALMSLVA